MKINNFKEFNEGVSNLSKIREWDKLDNKYQDSDFYFVYHLKKSELGKYLNTWFSGKDIKSKNSQTHRNEMITLKKVDDNTAAHLYNRKYNPISITIVCPTGAKFKQDKNRNDLYEMKATIHSIDDSSYGIWWDEETYKELEQIREELMKWINTNTLINGEEFLNKCISLGASEKSKDYN